eukprot:TRINITY_DN75019_c0_g1_i1.p1 TRINITY_DN75019_c0_g1~~TRINITY_DN75019_c0_g1_i1.p1  ORF type:complete len:820 (-),score=115.75 TRINITY_DN75019_c0_g1_i1:59-2479(-)
MAEDSDGTDALTKEVETMDLGGSMRGTPPLVGLLYDERMTLHHNLRDQSHPEQPLRIVKIFERLEKDGIASRCVRIPCRKAVREELELKHTKRHVEQMLTIADLTNADAVQLGRSFNSVYLCPGSLESALLSAGSVVEATERVCTAEVSSALCVVRPPGHHAEGNCAMGFCLFGNVAIAAAEARRRGWSKRTLIVDWDVHHGNGTQRMFEEDDSVLYFSTHRHDAGEFYPGSSYGNFTSHGRGNGAGYSVNVPWDVNRAASMGIHPPGDGEIVDAFERVLLPICEDFQPDLVLVSAGFDCAAGDPLGGCMVTPAGFYKLTSMLMGIANGRMVIALEGGYNLDSISASMAACAGALLGDPPTAAQSALIPEPEEIYVTTVRDVRGQLSQFWPKLTDPIPGLPVEALSGNLVATQLALGQYAIKTACNVEAMHKQHQKLLFRLEEQPDAVKDAMGGRRRVKVLHESFSFEESPPAYYVVPVIYSSEPREQALDLIAAAFDAGAHGVWLACERGECGAVAEVNEHVAGHVEESMRVLAECFSMVRDRFCNRWIGVRPSRHFDVAKTFKWLSSNASTADAVWIHDLPCKPAEVRWETFGADDCMRRYAVKLDRWISTNDVQPMQSLKRLRQNTAWPGLVFGGVALPHQDAVHHEQEGNKFHEPSAGSRVEALHDGEWFEGTITGTSAASGLWIVQCDCDATGVWTEAADVRPVQRMGDSCAALLQHWAGLASFVCDGIVTSGSNAKLAAMAPARPLALQVGLDADVGPEAETSPSSRRGVADLVFIEFGHADNTGDTDAFCALLKRWVGS